MLWRLHLFWWKYLIRANTLCSFRALELMYIVIISHALIIHTPDYIYMHVYIYVWRVLFTCIHVHMYITGACVYLKPHIFSSWIYLAWFFSMKPQYLVDFWSFINQFLYQECIRLHSGPWDRKQTNFWKPVNWVKSHWLKKTIFVHVKWCNRQ